MPKARFFKGVLASIKLEPQDGNQMSQTQCPICGRKPKPKANFCHFCGARLGAKQELPITDSSGIISKTESSIQSEKETEVPITDGVPAEVEDALILRGKLEALWQQKSAIEEELETLKVRQLVGELSETKAKKQIEQVEAKLSPITKEIKELEEKATTPLELLYQEHKTQEERLQRLRELKDSGEVDKSIYQRLANEYQNKMDEITLQLGVELEKAHRWLNRLEVQQQQLEFDKETLQVRARIDEISKNEVNKQLKDFEKELAKIKAILVGLHAILAISPTPTKATTASKASQPIRKIKSGKCPYCGNKISSDSKYCYLCGRLITG